MGALCLLFFVVFYPALLSAETLSTAEVDGYNGTSDGGTNRNAWQEVVDRGTNSRFGVVELTTNVTGLLESATYYYRFYASNGASEVWSPASDSFFTGQTAVVPPQIDAGGSLSLP